MLIKLSPRPPKLQSGSIPQVYGVEAPRVRGGGYLALSSGAINRAQIFHRVDSSAKAPSQRRSNRELRRHRALTSVAYGACL